MQVNIYVFMKIKFGLMVIFLILVYIFNLPLFLFFNKSFKKKIKLISSLVCFYY